MAIPEHESRLMTRPADVAASVENEMQVEELRECGVYALPGGREVIAIRSRYGAFKFYDSLAWKYYGPPMYEMDERGRITSFGRPTPWRIEDLMDLGQTASPQGH